jgi:phage/plasmid primase-like uncharacterized protein
MVEISNIWETINEDKNFAYKNTSKSISDLINQMNNDGLAVTNVDTSGNVNRVMVKATSTTRPDKGLERSGWYFFYDNGNGNFFCNYGNWRTNESFKFSSRSFEDYDPEEQLKIKAELEKRFQEEAERRSENQKEIAEECSKKFNSLDEPQDHKYLAAKKIKSYGLKHYNGKLVVPIFSSTSIEHNITSLQYIDHKGNKRFTSGGLVKGSFFNIGFNFNEWHTIKKIIVVEGYATASSVYQATGLPTICVFSANFGLEAVSNIRKFTNAEIILAFDNDDSGVGQAQAEKVSAAVHNCSIKIPGAIGKDFNDIFLEQGLEEVKRQLLVSAFNIKANSIKSLDNNPPDREWLVENLIESNKNGIIASIGGVGKSFICLNLAHSVAKGSGYFMGHPISKKGNAVIISAEDDLNEMHRRVSALDPEGERFKSLYDVFIISIPELSKPLTLIKSDSVNGLHITKQGYELIDSLESIPNLELVIIDPIQSFIAAPTNDNEVGQLYSQFCQMIASKLSTCVLSVHHMSKQGLVGIDDPMSARSSIRGASSLIDSSRFALALFLCDEDTAKDICLKQGVEYDRLKVVRAAVVKANSDADMAVKTMIRRKNVLEMVNQDDEIQWN